jgi:DNA processing protein
MPENWAPELLFLPTPSIRDGSWKSTIRRSCSTLKAMRKSLINWALAVVGTRHSTPYGTGMAERLACDLAARGLVVFNGMARGIDVAAHRGALNGHGLTVAIWGTGIDEVYPKENQRIADQILASGGAVLTEFPLGTFPAPQNFPIRNRIISGIAISVLVAPWEDVWEALPADSRLALTPPESPESQGCPAASLFGAADLPPAEKKVFAGCGPTSPPTSTS